MTPHKSITEEELTCQAHMTSKQTALLQPVDSVHLRTPLQTGWSIGPHPPPRRDTPASLRPNTGSWWRRRAWPSGHRKRGSTAMREKVRTHAYTQFYGIAYIQMTIYGINLKVFFYSRNKPWTSSSRGVHHDYLYFLHIHTHIQITHQKPAQ